MALTFTPISKMSWGNARATLQTITIGAAGDYSSGLTVTAANVRLGSIAFLVVVGGDHIGEQWYYDQSTGKLRANKTGAATSGEFIEVAGSDVSGDIILVLAVGDNANKG